MFENQDCQLSIYEARIENFLSNSNELLEEDNEWNTMRRSLASQVLFS